MASISTPTFADVMKWGNDDEKEFMSKLKFWSNDKQQSTKMKRRGKKGGGFNLEQFLEWSEAAGIGPGGAVGMGCGVGIGLGITGGMGIGAGIWNSTRIVFGIGGGCGIGIGYGFGHGIGVFWDRPPPENNLF